MESGPSASIREPGDGPDTASAPQLAVKSSVNPKRRRDKPQLSCDACRKRRLKCDRSQPCENCTKRQRRGIQQQCTYPGNRGKGSERPSIRHKVEELERQVRTLMSRVNCNKNRGRRRDSASVGPVEDPIRQPETVEQELERKPQIPETIDRLVSPKFEGLYDEDSQWDAVLNNISDIKDHYLNEPDHEGPSRPADGLSGLSRVCLGVESVHCPTQEDILRMLPPRHFADELLNKYFSVLTVQIVAQVMLHRPTFLHEYEEFWSRPQESPITWVGLLFSMLSIGACFHKQATSDTRDEPPPLLLSVDRPLVKKYREAAVQCLAIGRFSQVSDYLIETLLHLIHIQYLQHEDTEMEIWVMLGIAIRLAQRMGYHRDPSRFSDLTAFQAEMRRRVWLLISDLDITVSAMFGLPRMVSPVHCDTDEPRHLLDEDIHQNMTELPPSRPETEETPILYLVARQRILSLAARVSDFLSLGHEGRQEEALLLDERLQQAYERLPEAVKLKSKSSLYERRDGGKRLLRAVLLMHVYYKTRCLLHRPYLYSQIPEGIFSTSRKYCLESALQLLQCQAILYHETQPGGMLDKPWKMSSLMKQDYLLATTIISFDIDHAQVAGTAAEDSLCQLGVEALIRSYPIWLDWAITSREARKAVDMLRVVLGKAQGSPGFDTQPQNTTEASYRMRRATSNSDELAEALMSLSADNDAPPKDHKSSTSLPEQFFMFGFDDLVELFQGTVDSTGFVR